MEMVKIDETEILDALYGDGAWEISKAMTKEQERTQARVGLASNVLGLAAGTAAMVAAAKNPALRKTGATLKNAGPSTKYVAQKLNVKPKTAAKLFRAGAAGALGLQVANTAGDVVANRVLARGAKKPEEHVKKSDTPTEINVRGAKYVLAKQGVNVAAKSAKKAPVIGKKTFAAAQQVPEYAQRAVQTVKKDVDFQIRGEISKMNDEKKQVFGWASVIEVNGEPVIDLQGDVMTIDTIEKAAYTYVHGSRKGGRQHQRNGEEPLHVSDMIESFVLTPEKKSAMGLPDNVPTGWWVGFQINDDDTWDAYKDGRLKEFSIHGSGTRKALEF
jgi:hypothetical protein